MVARFAGAILGLLAFSITILAGLYVQNPVTVILSRGIFALFVFSLMGFALGMAAELVISEYEKSRESQIRKQREEDSTGLDDTDPNPGPTGEDAAATGA